MSFYEGWTGNHDEDFTVIGDDGTAVALYADGYGLLEEHLSPDGEMHQGSVMFIDLDGHPTWDVVAGSPDSLEGLTLTPSIACRRCSHHGCIREGRWVPA